MAYIEFSGEVTMNGRVWKPGQFLNAALVKPNILERIKAGSVKGTAWKDGDIPQPKPTEQDAVAGMLSPEVMAAIEQRVQQVMREEREKLVQEAAAKQSQQAPAKGKQASGEPSVLDGSVEDLRTYVKDVEDVEELQRLLAQEQAGKTRRGALQVISERLDELNAQNA